MRETHVIGMGYTDAASGIKAEFYIESDYDSEFARDLAYSVKYAFHKTSFDKAAIIGYLLEAVLNDHTGCRVLASAPESDHTIHYVDIDAGKVTLLHGTDHGYVVSYTVQQFLNRYKIG